MGQFELYNPEGLRVDGRRWNQLRHMKSELGTFKAADGSSVVDMGTSKVVCTVKGPQEPQSRSKSTSAGASFTVNIMIAPFASSERSKHASNERQIQEMAINLEHTFSEAVLLHLYPRTEILATINVLAQDGCLFPACVNAVTLALIDAGVAMREYMTSVAVAVTENAERLLDPNQIEMTELPSVSVACLGNSGEAKAVILETKLAADRLVPALELAIDGCKVIHDLMDEHVRNRGSRRLRMLAEGSL